MGKIYLIRCEGAVDLKKIVTPLIRYPFLANLPRKFALLWQILCIFYATIDRGKHCDKKTLLDVVLQSVDIRITSVTVVYCDHQTLFERETNAIA